MFKIECRNCGYFENKKDNFKMQDEINIEIIGEGIIKISCAHCETDVVSIDSYYADTFKE